MSRVYNTYGRDREFIWGIDGKARRKETNRKT
jgi:hypothetical protein